MFHDQRAGHDISVCVRVCYICNVMYLWSLGCSAPRRLHFITWHSATRCKIVFFLHVLKFLQLKATQRAFTFVVFEISTVFYHAVLFAEMNVMLKDLPTFDTRCVYVKLWFWLLWVWTGKCLALTCESFDHRQNTWIDTSTLFT